MKPIGAATFKPERRAILDRLRPEAIVAAKHRRAIAKPIHVGTDSPALIASLWEAYRGASQATHTSLAHECECAANGPLFASLTGRAGVGESAILAGSGGTPHPTTVRTKWKTQ